MTAKRIKPQIPIVRVPKRSGGYRSIFVQPSAARSAWWQAEHYMREVLPSCPNPHYPAVRIGEYLCGLPGCRDARGCAEAHRGRRYVATMDLASYFDRVPCDTGRYMDTILPGDHAATAILAPPLPWQCLADTTIYFVGDDVWLDAGYASCGEAQRAVIAHIRDYVSSVIEAHVPAEDRDHTIGLMVCVVEAHARCASASPTGGVPQGLSWSPIIATLGGLRMDASILAACRETGCTYTRYIDDMTISGDDRGAVEHVCRVTEAAAAESGHRVQSSKSHIWDTRYWRAHVTGHTVGETGPVRLRRDLRLRARAYAHRIAAFHAWVTAAVDRRRAASRVSAKYRWLQRAAGYITLYERDLAAVASGSDEHRRIADARRKTVELLHFHVR